MSQCSRKGIVSKSEPEILTEENIVMDEALVHNIVMDEEVVHNIVMDEEMVHNIVMDANIDPKVEMDLSVFKNGGWKIRQLSNRKLLEEYIEEASTATLLIRILSRDSSFVMHKANRDQGAIATILQRCKGSRHPRCEGNHHFQGTEANATYKGGEGGRRGAG